ncbi:MAG TPA: ATP-binding protein [Anaerovoracaceae bacterium]|nr:ATP-binding protein [Anaerovoracaceae bacterium]
MNRNIVLVFIIGILILSMGIYHYLTSNPSIEWGLEEEVYPLNSMQQKWLEEKKMLVIGVTDDSAPFLTFDESGNPQGLLKDYMDRIGEAYRIKLTYIPILAKEMKRLLENGEIDAAFSVQSMDPEQTWRFTMPVIKAKGILLVRKGLENSDDGRGLDILLAEGSPAYAVLQKKFSQANLILCDNTEDIAEKISRGEGNAIAGSESALMFFTGREELERNWEKATGYLYERNECLTVHRDNSVLFEILNNAVYYTDNAEVIAELQGKWTGVSYPLYMENKLEGLGIIIIIIFTAVLCVFFIFYQSNKSLYEELRQRMELLIESQHEMQTTFDGVTYYMAELGRDGTVININRAFAQYLSIKRHKAADLPFVSLLQVDEDEKKKLSAIIRETFRDESVKNDEIVVGRKIFEIHTFLIKNNKGQIQKILLMMIDVTEVRNTERQMLQNNKMIAIGQLAAGVAHEIRNPLGLIRNYCYVLKDIDYRDYITRDEAIAVIEKSVDKSNRIIDNLLNFSRLSTNKNEAVNLKVHVGSILDLQRSLLMQRKINLRYKYTGDGTVEINVEAIEIILVNLITNAVDAIAGDGEISVICEANLPYFSMSVADNGSGIPPEVMDEIYNPFFTTKKKSEGSGLGLYIVYNEVQKMGGEIKAESEVGQGTVFYIKIPIEGRSNE